MELDREAQNLANIEARVRRNAGPAGLVAGILIFIGFILFSGEAGAELTVKGSPLLRYALRAGGVAMIGVAIASSIGTVWALLADTILSVLVGLLIVLSGVVMVAEGVIGVGQVIVFICGAILVTLGLRTLADYRAILRGLRGAAEIQQEVEALKSLDDPFRVPAGSPDSGEKTAPRPRSDSRSSTSGRVGRRGQDRVPHGRHGR